MTCVAKELSRPLIFFSLLLFIPFFLFRFTWGHENQFVSLYLHVPQAAIALLGAAIYFRRYRLDPPTYPVVLIFSTMLAVHVLHALVLRAHLKDYGADYFSQGIQLWAYLFVLCYLGVVVKPEDRVGLVRCFDLMAKIFVVIAIAAFVFYKVSGLAFLVRKEADGLLRLQGFFSEPSAFAPVVCWLVLSGLYLRSYLNIALAAAVCVLSYSPIILIALILSLFSYIIIFYPRFLPWTALLLVLVSAWSLQYDCRFYDYSSPLTRASCGIRAIFGHEAAIYFPNDRLRSSMAVFSYLSVTESWVHGLGLNSTSVFMPRYYDELRDNSLVVSLLAFYGIAGGVMALALSVFGLFMSWRRRDLLALLWLSFFWCSLINSAQGFITYGLLFMVTFWVADPLMRQNSVRNSSCVE